MTLRELLAELIAGGGNMDDEVFVAGTAEIRSVTAYEATELLDAQIVIRVGENA